MGQPRRSKTLMETWRGAQPQGRLGRLGSGGLGVPGTPHRRPPVGTGRRHSLWARTCKAASGAPCWLDVPRQGGPGAAKGPPWTRARPRSARLRRTKASLVGRGLQEAPFATIVTGRSCRKLGPSLAGAWRRLGVGVEWGGRRLPLLQLNAGPLTAGLALLGIADPSQWKENRWSTVCRGTLETRVTPPTSPGFHHFNCSPKGSVCPKVLRNLRWVLEKILLIQ